MARFIEEHFVPFTVNLSEKAGLFGRFEAAWTPTVLVMSSKGKERLRLEGYVDPLNFKSWMMMGLGRDRFMAKQFEEAQRWYAQVEPGSGFGAEAMYWEAVCKYNATKDPTPLQQVAEDLPGQHPDSIWSLKTRVWKAGEEERQTA